MVVDFVCYRRHGHQEADNPHFTQPHMYSQIRRHPPTLELYQRRLVADGKFEPRRHCGRKVLSDLPLVRAYECLSTALNSCARFCSPRIPSRARIA